MKGGNIPAHSEYQNLLSGFIKKVPVIPFPVEYEELFPLLQILQNDYVCQICFPAARSPDSRTIMYARFVFPLPDLPKIPTC